MDCIKHFRSRAYYYLVSAGSLVGLREGFHVFLFTEHIKNKLLNFDKICLGFFLLLLGRASSSAFIFILSDLEAKYFAVKIKEKGFHYF